MYLIRDIFFLDTTKHCFHILLTARGAVLGAVSVASSFIHTVVPRDWHSRRCSRARINRRKLAAASRASTRVNKARRRAEARGLDSAG